MRFFKFISNIFNVFTKASKIRENEDARKKSVRFALSSIIYSVVMVACALVGGLLFSLNDTGLFYIFLIAIAVILFVSVIIEFLGALIRVIVQFTINKSVASWIALIFFVIAVISTIIILVHFIG